MADVENKIRIFLSYQWGSQEHVKKLKEFLTVRGYDVWMDDNQLHVGNDLQARISEAILTRNIFIACITKRYVASPMCNREINLARNSNRYIIPLMFDQIEDKDLGDISSIIGNFVPIQIYKEPGVLENWTGQISEQVINSIKNYDQDRVNIS